MKKIFTMTAIVCSVIFANAQSFMETNKTVFSKPIWCGGVKALDADNDGDLDFVVFGESGGSGSENSFTIWDPTSQSEKPWAPNKGASLWLNGGNKFFTEGTLPVAGFWNAVANTTDWDGNGDVDLIAGRWDPNGSVFLLNDGSGTFTVGAPFTDFTAGDPRDIVATDFNNDGNLDLVETNNGNNCNVYFLDQAKAIKSKVTLSLTEGLWDPSCAVFDFNNDGLNDIYITGGSQSNGPVVGEIFYNNGDETFRVEQLPTGKWFGGLHTGDFNGDGKFDMVMEGKGDYGDGEFVAYIYTNTGTGFAEFQKITPGWNNEHFANCVKFVDYNNDGKLEILFSGKVAGVTNAQIAGYKLNALGTAFVEDFTFLGAGHASLDCADFNSDGKVDILLSGENGEPAADRYTQLFWNQTAAVNAAPTAPTNLRVSYSETELKYTFEWAAATDDHTPANGLTYNLYVIDNSTGKYLYSPLADTTTGFRKVGDHGNVGNNLKWKLALPVGDYTWSVQSVDAAFVGSAFASAHHQTLTSLAKLTSNRMIIGQNPVDDQLSITSTSRIKSIAILTVEGKQVKNIVVNNETAKITVSSLQSGLYIFRITYTDNATQVSRFVKK